MNVSNKHTLYSMINGAVLALMLKYVWKHFMLPADFKLGNQGYRSLECALLIQRGSGSR